MDQSLLVTSGHQLVDLLRDRGLNIKAALWFHNVDADSWRLWIVPSKEMKDKHEFYRIVSETISAHRASLPGIDASDTELIPENHPVISALKGSFKVTGRSTISIESSYFNGFYLPRAIVIEYDL